MTLEKIKSQDQRLEVLNPASSLEPTKRPNIQKVDIRR